jgi:ribosomal protein S18 acetylase RimI-like enzyme
LIDIKTIEAQDTIDLRHKVMWPELPKKDVMLPEDADGMHLGAFRDGQLIGVGSFFSEDKTVQLRKLAVDEAFQGQGIARCLLTQAFNLLTKNGFEVVWCHARVSATEFYRKIGFDLECEVFQKRGVDYVIARKTL